MATVTSGAFAKALWPGIDNWYQEGYDEHIEEFSKIFVRSSSGKKFEQTVGQSGIGLAAVKAEGASMNFDDVQQTYVNQYTHLAYYNGLVITRETFEDNQYNLDVFKPRSRALASAMRQTMEWIGANVLNNGFDTSYTMGSTSDGKPLFSATHLNGPYGSSASNLMTAADISELALENMVIACGNMTDARGLKIAVRPDMLIIPVELEPEARRILGSEKQNDTANNAINVLRAQGMIPGGVMVSHYMVDSDAYFLTTSITRSGNGLRWFDRRAMEFDIDNEFDTENAKFKASFRVSAGWDDWRGALGSQGI